MRRMVEQAELQHRVVVDSAGTHDYHTGDAPDPRAQAVAKKRGYDLSMLRARQVQPSDFVEFDLLLAMDFNNFAALQDVCPPGMGGKVSMLMPFATNRRSSIVHDPYYRSAKDFELVLDCIEDACEGLLQLIVREELLIGVRPDS